jgi:hypothetical protein
MPRGRGEDLGESADLHPRIKRLPASPLKVLTRFEDDFVLLARLWVCLRLARLCRTTGW